MYVFTFHMDKNICIYAYIRIYICYMLYIYMHIYEYMLKYKYMCAVNICPWVWGYIC